jgi:SPP1 gp7 family putative phage head morphogenesis protein
MSSAAIRNVPPEEAIRFFRTKGLAPSFAWQDFWAHQHAMQFTVAKSTGFDILGDIFNAMDAAIAEGTTFADFKRQLTPILQEKGWWGRKAVIDPATGERKFVQLGSPRRLRIIFDTNMRTAYAAGRWARFQASKRYLPFLRYSAVMDSRTRPEHRAWHGTILAVDHPWWETHFPPNGWNCRCTVTALTWAQVKARGKDPEKLAPPPGGTRPWVNPRTGQRINVPEGIDPGFGHNAGKIPIPGSAYRDPSKNARQLKDDVRGFNPAMLARNATPDDPWPAPRDIPASWLLPEGETPEFYAEAFLRALGASFDKPSVVVDPLGMPVPADRSMVVRMTGQPKTGDSRGPLAKILASAIRTPQEIWLTVDGSGRLKRTYVLRFRVEGDAEDRVGVAIYTLDRDGWFATTAFEKTVKSGEALLRQASNDYRWGVRLFPPAR